MEVIANTSIVVCIADIRPVVILVLTTGDMEPLLHSVTLLLLSLGKTQRMVLGEGLFAEVNVASVAPLQNGEEVCQARLHHSLLLLDLHPLP
ncbi:hypothetical protein CEXT_741281 [Caerostris extrusa]|uniref:Uncharacterized protein n=1 Tax=Caerostris extrusa TaxID=172846 RepID=A0AAV4MWM6_CAEEX|nr:hypothetical protein CEXT_741281 [Caerostris extrusa]